LRLFCLVTLLLTSVGCDNAGRSKKPTIETPRILADGGRPAPTPSELRRFQERPVLGARELRAREAISACPIDRASLAKSRFSQAWVSTDGLTVELKSRPSVLIACDAARDGGRWEPCGSGDTRSLNPRRVELAGGSLDVACQSPTRIEAMWIAVPRAANWTLVDHGRFWVAYSSARRPLIRISNRGSSGRFRVVFLDRRTRVLRERQITGYVAG
jgi:hypothetical protein